MYRTCPERVADGRKRYWQDVTVQLGPAAVELAATRAEGEVCSHVLTRMMRFGRQLRPRAAIALLLLKGRSFQAALQACLGLKLQQVRPQRRQHKVEAGTRVLAEQQRGALRRAHDQQLCCCE